MSSTLIISEDSAWMPQVGTFFRVVENTLEILGNKSASTLGQILLKATEAPYLHLQDLNEVEFKLFTGAVETVLERSLIERKSFSWIPSLKAIAELKALLLVDPRITQTRQSRNGRIVINPVSSWSNSEPAYDLALEYTALEIEDFDENLKDTLLKSRILKGTGQLDLQKFDLETFQLFLQGVRELETHYLVPFRLSARPKFLPQFHLEVLNLVNLLKEDKRGQNFLDKHSFEYLKNLVLNPKIDDSERNIAAKELGYRKYGQSFVVLKNLINSPSQPTLVRTGAIFGIAEIGSSDAIECLLDALDDEDKDVREIAEFCLLPFFKN